MMFFNALCIVSSLTNMGFTHLHQEPFPSYGEKLPISLLKTAGYCHFFYLKDSSHIKMNTFNLSPKESNSAYLNVHLATGISPK